MPFKILDPNKAPAVITTQKDLRYAIFADGHAGSNFGFLSSNCCDERGNPYPQNKEQKKSEKNLIAELDKVGKVDVLQYLGDMADGKNSKAGGLDVGNVNTDVQVEWAINLGKTIIDRLKPSIVMGINGSDYHVDNSLDRQIIRGLSLIYPDIEFYYGTQLKVIFGDKLWFLNHRFAEGVSKAGSLEKFWNKLHSELYGRGRTPDVIGYGHIHKAQNPYQIKNGPNPVYGFVSPGLKLPDSFCSKNPSGTHWEIGFMLIEQKGVKMTGEYINTYSYWLDKQ
jgi:hypothetical protein